LPENMDWHCALEKCDDIYHTGGNKQN